MNYYDVCVIGQNVQAFTFESNEDIDIGTIVRIRIGTREKEGCVVKKTEQPTFKTTMIAEIFPRFFSTKQLSLARFISSYYVCELSQSLALFEPFSRSKTGDFSSLSYENICLSDEQQNASDELKKHDIALLFGDTGSGKTEIYMQHIKEVLEKGEKILFLMPEISLTPQMLSRLKKKFGDAVGVWHSKQSKKQKEATLDGIHNNTIRIVVGPRSALFLPIDELGLIVVDEEHDDSYKSAQAPRYNAKDMAITYAKIHGARCILGSATPSLTSYKNYPTIRLAKRYYDASKEFVFEHSETTISPLILTELARAAKEKKQTVVFLPTRANFKYMLCKQCGKSVECPFCSVPMSLHLDEGLMKCHYCGYSEPIGRVCPQCGEGELEVCRMGTQEAISTISAELPTLSIQKFDRDEITTQKKLEETLSRFANRKIDVLVGTQMLSKGHDYHNVSLAIILGLDSILAQNDFRAREHALSLLVQIAGRAGRKEHARIIVQTLNAAFFRQFLSDYELFLQDELRNRRDIYPPDTRLARLLFSDKNGAKAEEKMRNTLARIKECNIDIVGFGEAAIGRIAGKYRFDILLRDPSAKRLLEAIYTVDDKSFEVDMDPISFL